MRFQQVNKYRNVVGRIEKKELWYADLPVATTSSSDKSNLVQASGKWIAVKWNTHGGSIGLLPIDNPGKQCGQGARVFHAHGAAVSDWQFSEFNDDLLATGAEDGLVKLWSLSKETDPACLTTFSIPSRRVDSIQFHPAADQILSTLGNEGKRICIWNMEISDTPTFDIDAPSVVDQFHSFSWKQDGVLLSTSAKGALGIWDPRATTNKQVALGGGHDGIKGSRVVWLGESNYLFTAGQSKFRSREYGVWDARNLATPVKKASLDQSTGIMLPLYDQDTETMYLIGRGDATIRSLQFSDLVASPSVSENMACGTQATVYGATLVPKTKLNVMRAEVARVLTVVDDAVMPVSFEVPRKQYLDFHADLFPDTKGNKPALSGPDWVAGKNGLVEKISLDPAAGAAAPKSTAVITPAAAPTPTPAVPAALTPTSPAPMSAPEHIPVAIEQQQSIKSSTSTAPVSIATMPSSLPPSAQSAPNAAAPTNSSNPETSSITESKPKKKQLPQYGSANRNTYKYLSGKLYHPSTHYDDLRDLSFDKGGSLELIQANVKFMAVPIAGAGGRVGIIRVDQPGRLPTHIPSVLCRSPVTYFAFDPFDPHILATASEDNVIRLWKLPETGIEQDMSEDGLIGKLEDTSIEKISMIAFHPTARGVLMSVSNDLNKPAVRVWDVVSGEPKIRFETESLVLSAAWSVDGAKVAVHGKDKKLRIFDARTGQAVSRPQTSHDGIRPSRLVWLDETRLVSVGFGAGSMREILVFNLDKRVAKRSIDISPSVMSVYYDPDCQVLYVAGRGDRIIHTYAVLDTGLDPLAKIEGLTLQQGFAFLPKRACHVAEIEIARFFRLTPTSIEPYGVRVPRARPEYFQDDIFIDTADIEHPAQDAKSWFEGNQDRPLARISLKPESMIALSDAPPPPQKEQAKAKFEFGKKIVSDEERRQNLMDRMFSTAKHVDEEKETQQKVAVPEVDEDEWDD